MAPIQEQAFYAAALVETNRHCDRAPAQIAFLFSRRVGYAWRMMKTQAIRIHEFGSPDVIRIEEVDLPQPAEGEVRIRHTAIGLNFIDTYHRTGLYPIELPAGLGSEAAAVVESVGTFWYLRFLEFP